MKKPSSKIREEIGRLQEQLKQAETREAERIGRLALRAGLGDIEIEDSDLVTAFEEVAAKLPAGRQLSIKVLDVNLAGELEWVRRATSEIRVLRDVTWPMVEFEYTLSENGRVLKSDTVRLSDMGYLQGGFFTAAQQSTHLRYERRMLDRWYRDTIEGHKR